MRVIAELAESEAWGSWSGEPCQNTLAQGCPVYPARAPFRGALEVNAGYFAQHDIKVGDRLVLRDTANRPRASSAGAPK